MDQHQVALTLNEQEQVVIKVFVNNKPVNLKQRVISGYEIKKAAINQGVAIQLDFLLYVVHDDGQLKLIKDNEQIHIHELERFRAVTPDDVSEV
jgi:hypothetical protein